MGCEFHRLGIENNLTRTSSFRHLYRKNSFDVSNSWGTWRKFKLPTLTELHNIYLVVAFGEAHNATADVEATTRCFLELIRLREFTKEQLDVRRLIFKIFRSNPKPFKLLD